MTHGAKNGESFSEMMGPSLSNSIIYLHTDTDTCMHICIFTADYTVKPVLSVHSKEDQLSLNAGHKYCRMLQEEHSAILLTFIKLPFVIKIFVLRHVLLY